MRLLYVTNTLEIGGAETSLVRLTGALRQRGHDVDVVSAGGALVEDLERAGGRHHEAPIRLGILDLLRSAVKVRSVVRRVRPDIIHALSPAGNLATQLLARGRRPAVVSSPMGLQASAEEPGWLTFLRNAMMVLRAERVLVISEEIGRSLAPLRLDPSRTVLCNVNGIDVETFAAFPTKARADALRHELGVEPDSQLVVTIGALHPRKSHDLFVRAAAIVHRTHPLCRFLVVGEGPERASLASLIGREALAGVVTLTGARRDVADLLAIADVCVKPGVVEGFVGLTVLEAMAARVPVVAFDTRDVRAAIDHDLTGVLVPRADVAALAAAIRRVLDDQSGTLRLTEAAYDHVRERFALDVVAADVERVYSGALVDR